MILDYFGLFVLLVFSVVLSALFSGLVIPSHPSHPSHLRSILVIQSHLSDP